MNEIKKIIILSLCCLPVQGLAQWEPRDFEWINRKYAYIQFADRAALEPFIQKWQDSLKPRVNILYMGDSHIQPDIVTHQFRGHVHRKLGDGGRGLIFPYSIARTYSSFYYKSYHTGTWTASRSIEYRPKYALGFSGITGRTLVPGSSFTIRFSEPLPADYTVLKIFCKPGSQSFDLEIWDGTHKTQVQMDSVVFDGAFFTVPFTPKHNQVTVTVVKNKASQVEFELYGLSLEANYSTGAIVHAAGIGGAQINAPLFQKLFQRQLPSIQPDLIILDYGTNDYIYFDKLRPDLEADIVRIIRQIREVVPSACILLTSTHDMKYRGRYCRSGPAFAELIRRIAFENRCGFFDWYWITGGPGAVNRLQRDQILQPDLVHMTIMGAKLKANMLYESWNRTAAYLQAYPSADTLQAEYPAVTRLPEPVPAAVVPANPGKTRTLVHTVRSGQTLSHLAALYGVKVSDIQRWNGLTGTLIRVGQKLTIHAR
jgi:lysophospholipase L1-like esterase